MSTIGAVLFILVLLYKLYAIPLGVVVAFLLTRRLMRKHGTMSATWFALAWTVPVFTPMVVPSQTFFSGTYAPWYVVLMTGAQDPEASAAGLAITIAVSLFGSAMAAMNVSRSRP